ncbi:MAG: hypothetical protein K6E32_07650 [Lachnospiraceae bacterium]|nr:hypothetical protein [Lachnospiraceae bacterium]
MDKMRLITPTHEVVEVFNSFWTDSPISSTGKLFEDDEEIDLSKYISQFIEYGEKDEDIIEKQNLLDFLDEINSVYHTRVSEISLIVKELEGLGINNKASLSEKIESGELNLPKFLACCKEATGNYTYSFASKVFSFIDEEKYPIIDSFVATLLNTYVYDGIAKSKWGDYSKYIDNYNVFRRHFGLEDLSFKKIDKFLWTYAKILSEYWSDLGVLSYDPVAFDPKSLKEC